MNLTTGLVLDQLGAAALLALALFVWRVRSGAASNRWFGLYVGASALVLLADNTLLYLGQRQTVTWTVLWLVGFIVWAVTLVGFARSFPTPFGALERTRMGRARHLRWAVPLIAGLIMAAFDVAQFDRVGATWAGPPLVRAATLAASDVWNAAVLYAGILFALRFRHAPPAAHAFRRDLALLAVLVLLRPLVESGMWSMFPEELPWLLGPAIGLVVTVGLWLDASRGAGSTTARDVALVLLALPLVGMLLVTFGPAREYGDSGLWGVTRLATAAIIAYAILRHQLFDIERQVKWTVKQSTIAGAFIGVFFVASEAAQVFFGDAAGSQYVGILAAGFLVFLLAPLQRLAGHVAERAMPRVQDTEAYVEGRRRSIYRAAVESAMRDGVVTDAERDVLATLAEELGLKPTEARAVEREAVSAQAPTPAPMGS